MLNKKQIIESFKSTCIDGRDLARLAIFFDKKELKRLGLKPKANATWKSIKLTRKNVLSHLKRDLAFGFDKALNQRGLSSSLMYDVVKMWMWILQDTELENPNDDLYTYYGLQYFKAVALKYGFDNPLGRDKGNEEKYNG